MTSASRSKGEDVAAVAAELTKAQVDFLTAVCDGRKLGLADRAADKVRQQLRRAGLVHVVQNPRRWVAKPLGLAVRAHLTAQEGQNR